MAAFAQDLLTRIINIKWRMPLAVEFYDGAGPPDAGETA